MDSKIKKIIKKSKLKTIYSEFIIARLKKEDTSKLINNLSKIKNFYALSKENKEVSLIISREDWNKVKNNFEN